MKKTILPVLGVLALVLSPALPVFADEADGLTFEAETLKESDSSWKVTLSSKSQEQVTNGKIRVFYDAETFTLKSNEADGVLKNAMPTINDSLSGNKKEGEIVLVFASSSPVTLDGDLLSMEFTVTGPIKTGDVVSFSASVEESKNNGRTVTLTDASTGFEVGKEGSVTPSETPGDQGDDKTDGAGNKDDSAKNDKKNPGTAAGYPLFLTGSLMGLSMAVAGAALLKKRQSGR